MVNQQGGGLSSQSLSAMVLVNLIQYLETVEGRAHREGVPVPDGAQWLLGGSIDDEVRVSTLAKFLHIVLYGLGCLWGYVIEITQIIWVAPPVCDELIVLGLYGFQLYFFSD